MLRLGPDALTPHKMMYKRLTRQNGGEGLSANIGARPAEG